MKEVMMTPFSNKVSILGNFFSEVVENADVLDTPFMQDHRDTLWICLASNVGYVVIEERFHWAVDNAWDSFCEYLGIDSHGEYSTLVDMMEFADE
jgi:hypothetical protein